MNYLPWKLWDRKSHFGPRAFISNVTPHCSSWVFNFSFNLPIQKAFEIGKLFVPLYKNMSVSLNLIKVWIMMFTRWLHNEGIIAEWLQKSCGLESTVIYCSAPAEKSINVNSSSPQWGPVPWSLKVMHRFLMPSRSFNHYFMCCEKRQLWPRGPCCSNSSRLFGTFVWKLTDSDKNSRIERRC